MKKMSPSTKNSAPYCLLGFVALLFFTSCNTGPEPINFGEEQCAYCRMNIVDPKFGGELVTEKGRIYKFDAVECLIPYKQQNDEVEYSHELAIAFDEPESLYPVDELTFMQSEAFKSPMGSNVAGFKNVKNNQAEATEVEWTELQKRFAPR